MVMNYVLFSVTDHAKSLRMYFVALLYSKGRSKGDIIPKNDPEMKEIIDIIEYIEKYFPEIKESSHE
jgi:hypothetical protein